MAYYVFKKENFQEILNFAKNLRIPDRKGKMEKMNIILLENFGKNENKNVIENENLIDEDVKIFNGLMFDENFTQFNIKDVRKNLDKIIFCSGSNKSLHKISMHNEVDVIKTNELLDETICKFANKNYISYAFDFSEVLNVKGMQRVKAIGIMRKNFLMVKKYKVNFIISTFAGSIFEYKPYAVLISFGKILGMSDEESRNAVSKNFENLIRKFNNRNDENLLTDGLYVIKFGEIKKEKKKYGYY